MKWGEAQIQIIRSIVVWITVLILIFPVVYSTEIMDTLQLSSKKTYTLDSKDYTIFFYGFTPNPSQCNFQINGGASDLMVIGLQT